MSFYWIVSVTFLISFLFWESTFLFPMKMLSVLVHELWHSLLAMFFNVEWIQFHIYKNETGRTMIKGTMPLFGFIVTALAGYIGTLFTGSFFLRLIVQKQLQDLIFFIFCGILFLISFALVPMHSLGFYVGLGWFLGLILLYLINKNLAIHLFSIIQSFFIFYSFYDLLDFSKSPYESDIGILYQYLHKQKYYEGKFEPFLYVISFMIISLNIYIFYKLILFLVFSDSTNSQKTLSTNENSIHPQDPSIKENSYVEENSTMLPNKSYPDPMKIEPQSKT